MENIKKICQRSRYLKWKATDIIMRPVSEYNLKIAPAFYITQVDLTGPFNSGSKRNKGAILRIWLVVVCLVTTTTVNIKVLDNYSTTEFTLAFIRFSYEVGYPKKLVKVVTKNGECNVTIQYTNYSLNVQNLLLFFNLLKSIIYLLSKFKFDYKNAKRFIQKFL